MPNNLEEKRNVEVSDVLEKFGKYQIVQYLLVGLPCLFVSMININYVFVAGDLNYRCLVPECENGSSQFIPTWGPNTTIDKCSRHTIKHELLNKDGTCNNESFSGNLTDCSEWVYESDNTIIAELNLACQPWKSNLIGTIHNIGMLFSMLVAGFMSDRLGRKPTMLFCAVSSSFGQLKTFTSSYYLYVIVEFLESMLSGGIYPVTTVLMIEITGKRNRILAGIILSYIVYLGELTFSAITMFVPYWKAVIRIIYTPPIFCFLYASFIKESPRWQIINGKIDQAKSTIKLAANMNNVQINKNVLEIMNEESFKESFKISSIEKVESYRNIFASKEILKRLFVCSVCRFTVGFVYYGLMINSVWLPGDKHTNFFLSTIMSFPGELIAYYFMNKVGRKQTLIVGYFVSGVLCVVSAYIPTPTGKLFLFLISKMVIAACYTGIITYMSELFPTNARGSLLGIGAVVSMVGAMLAPLTPILMPISPALPMLLFFGSAVISSGLLFLTPETRDLPLMDTVHQMQNTSASSKNI